MKFKFPKLKFRFELRNYICPISLVVLGLGVFSLYLSIPGCFFASYRPLYIGELIDRLGAWNQWLLLIGVLAVIFGGGYFIDFMLKRRKLLKFIRSNSKASFLRNQDEIEYLAWRLGAKYESMVMDKKSELGIRG